MILVTGGAGFIGSHLVRRLVELDESVRVFDLPNVCVEHLPLDRIEMIRGDVCNRMAVRNAVRGCRQVYHLAANPNLWTRDRSQFAAVNHEGAMHVLQEGLDAGADRVLHTSTESILAQRKNGVDEVETLQIHEEDMIGPYCRSKFFAEKEAFRLAAQGAPVVVVAPTLPVGPGDYRMTPPTRMTVAFCKGKLPAFLDCRFNMIDVRDVAAGMVAAMRCGRLGKRYLLGSRNLHLGDWLAIVGSVVHRSPPRWQAPYWLALVAAWVSERAADICTGKTPNATLTGVRLTRRSMHFDPTNSLAELGIQPRPLEEAARDAVAWYRALGWIA